MNTQLFTYFFLLIYSIGLASENSNLKEKTATVTEETFVMPLVSMDNITVFENVGTVDIPIYLDAPDTVDTVINITTVDGSAVSPNDYTALMSTVTIPAGQTSVVISISIVDDTLAEPTEDFHVQGTVTSGNSINNSMNATITMNDQDDSAFSIADATIQEHNGSASVSLNIDQPSSVDTVISITTTDNTATNPNDYATTTVTATIPAGQVSINVSIPIIDDNIGEPTEDFNVNGTVTSGNATNPSDSGTITIIDNDTPVMTIADVTVSEDDGTATVPISITNPSSVDTVVDLTTVTGTAGTDDFTTTSIIATIPAAQTSVDVSIPITDDLIEESIETFSLNGTVVSGNTSNSNDSGTITIIDNDICTSNPISDCDGDGVTNENEINPPNGGPSTNPEDPCDFNASDATLPQSGVYLVSDCDGDGVTSGDELNPQNGGAPTDPNDACSFHLFDVNISLASWFFLMEDCDGDGTSNGDEIDPDNDGFIGAGTTDPLNPCSFPVGTPNLPQTGDYLTADCDGDGDLNGNDPDPVDPCVFTAGSIPDTTNPTWQAADCDGDGTLNAIDCDPFDSLITQGYGEACDDGDPLTLSDFIDENCNCVGAATSDVDGDGISNMQEVLNGTDYNNSCDPVQSVGYTGFDADNSMWQAANCDNDDVNNALEIILGTDPYDTNYNSIEGTMAYDLNNDGCNGTDDLAFPYARININDGTTTETVFTNSAGDYSYETTTGSFTITPDIENPTFFTIDPVNAIANFSNTNNNVFNQDFCIISNGVNLDVEIIIAQLGVARPGFNASYLLRYRNKGNQTVSGVVDFTYDDTVLDFVGSSEMPSSQVTGALSWNYADLAPFESRSINIVLNVNGPTEIPAINIGDQLLFMGAVTPISGDVLPNDNQFNYSQTVVGSYDPNDITCVEGSFVDPVNIGKDLHYIINFENTGTFFAENIVVEMQIDPAEFDINTLQLLSASHEANVSIHGDMVRFIFQNIFLLPDGQGHILIKMKSLSTLVENDIVSNQANIFFDYNFPIQTNNAETTFAVLSNPEFEIDSSITLYPNPTRNNIQITANNAIKSVVLYDIQGRLLTQEKYNTKDVSLNISNQTSGIYFIKISTEKGVNTEKIIKM